MKTILKNTYFLQENNLFGNNFAATKKHEANPFDTVFSSAAETKKDENSLVDGFNNFDPYSPVLPQKIPPKKQEDPFNNLFASCAPTPAPRNPKSMTLPAKNNFSKTNPFSGDTKAGPSGHWDPVRRNDQKVARSGSESNAGQAQDAFSDLLSMWKVKEGM